jgi:glycosyltransferase domain-containing protein
MMTTEHYNLERSVTLIIPSVYHRARFLDRVLYYLSHSSLQCPIVVTDHSPQEHAGVIDEIVRRQRGLDITLLMHPTGLHFLERLSDCATVAQTPFVHLHADDDFVVRPTLSLLIAEMQRRPELAAAMGLNVHVTFETGELTMLPKTGLQQAKPFERLVGQLQMYSSVLYALRRREEFIESLSFAVKRCPDVQFWQYLESCIAVLSGPIAVLEDLHYVREVHSDKWSVSLTRERSPDHFPYLVLSPEFSPRVAACRDALVAACEARRVPIDREALDAGLVLLLHRGFGAMGLPDTQVATPNLEGNPLARLSKRFSDNEDPITIELNRIFHAASR